MIRNFNGHLSVSHNDGRGGAEGFIDEPIDGSYVGTECVVHASFVQAFLGSSVVWAALRDSFLRNNRAWGAITI